MRGTTIGRITLLVGALALSGCSYNRLVGLREGIDAAWAQVENQLQRRNDLIPNLVETTKGFAQHEEAVYKDIADSAELKNHPFYSSKPRTVDTYFKTSLEHSSSTANEMLKGVNPLAGFVHGRSVLAQTVQKVVIDKMAPREAAKWGARELDTIRKENMRLIG